MIITREKGMRMWGGGSGSTSASGVNGGGGFSLAVEEGEGTGNAYTDFTYESGTLTLNKATEFVTVDFFNKLFTAYDANGNVIAPNNTTPTLDNIKFKAGAWTEQYLSALGQNSSGGGGGGGIELSDVWQSLKTNTDDYANQKINSAHIPDLSGTYATKTWVNQQGFVTSSGVTSVAMTVPTGLSVSGSPITTTGTLALTFANGYSIPTTAKQGNWDTAYGWGNHASAGYASASSVTTLQGYFTNGVANTAAKLNTPKTIWGQSFDGTGNVSGTLTDTGSIRPLESVTHDIGSNALAYRYVYATWVGSPTNNILQFGANNQNHITVTTNGNVGIGTTSPSYKLHVVGTVGVSNAITLTGSTASARRIYFGDTSHYLELDSTGFHFSHGVYSDSFVSALGANSSGGGSGTFDEEAMWTALGTTSTAKVIASSHIPNLDASKITSGTLAAARIPLATSSARGGVKVGYTTNGKNYAVQLSNEQMYVNVPWTDHYAWSDITGKPSSFTPSAHNHSQIVTEGDNRGVDTTPNDYVDAIKFRGLKSKDYIGSPSNDRYSYLVGLRGWSDSSGGNAHELAFNDSGIYRRQGATTTWGNWYKLLDSGNYSSYALPLGGGTLTGQLTISTGADRKLVINNTDTETKYSLISFQQNGTEYGTLGTQGTDNLTWNGYTILHSNNTYVSSGKGYINGTEITTINGNAATASMLYYSHTNEINFKGGMQAFCFFNYRNADTGNEDGGTTAINYMFCNYTRSTAYSTVTAGTFVGALSGNATTATTLQTSRTIWGQSFDGSSNVSGSITGATTITASGRISASSFKGNFVTDDTVFYFGNSQHAIGSGTDAVLWAYGANSLLFYTNGSRRMTINSEGSVGIGTSSPSSKLHVTGNILASGEVTASSDKRLKTIVGDGNLDIRYIANAPNILFKWNNGQDDKVHGGSLAQYFLHGAKHFVLGSDKDYYSLNYGALATSMAISIAKEVVKHEDRITLLEKENARLKARVEELEERRIA